jgi:hypothetical protein
LQEKLRKIEAKDNTIIRMKKEIGDERAGLRERCRQLQTEN